MKDSVCTVHILIMICHHDTGENTSTLLSSWSLSDPRRQKWECILLYMRSCATCNTIGNTVYRPSKVYDDGEWTISWLWSMLLWWWEKGRLLLVYYSMLLINIGVKLYLGGGKVRYISSTGVTQTLDVSDDTAPDPIKHQYQHALKVLSSLLVSAALTFFLQCLQNCQQVEMAIAAIETQSNDDSYFPVTIRRYSHSHQCTILLKLSFVRRRPPHAVVSKPSATTTSVTTNNSSSRPAPSSPAGGTISQLCDTSPSVLNEVPLKVRATNAFCNYCSWLIPQVPAYRATPNSMSTSTDPHHSTTSTRDLTHARRCHSDMVTKQEKQSLHRSERACNGRILREKNSQGGLKRRDGTHQQQQPVVTKNVHVAGVGWASLVSVTMHAH